MPLYFQRPENALKRANEFIDVGDKQWALDALYDVIKSRKHRTWQKIHEPIMIKYLELCVDLKKSHIAKEGLFQYRNICQQVNIKSLEDVVRGYLSLAEEKTEAARIQSHQAVVDIDDLDQVQSPESLLLSAVSNEDTQDRTDRVVLTPWVKFLWESYRQCLELLRNNSRIERLYHDIAQQAFKFCLKYIRKTEFRKLCDNLRAHLGHIHKHQNQQTSINLNNPESQAMHLETRLVQLDSAIQMELWQEAYKAIEDIHGLMNLPKKAPNPRLMANYYQKLSLVFWKSSNYLFHAAALFRLFHLSREQKKNFTQEEILKLAARVVLATLAIPMPPNRSEIDRLVETDENVIDKNHRLLSTLLGLPNPPSRASLIKDLVKFGIIQCAPSQLQDMYKLLETEFNPLNLCARIQQSFEFLNNYDEIPELRQYIPPIQDITVVRLIKEISQVYHTIRFTRLLQLCPFVQSFNLEYIVVEIARRNDLQVRIDHQKECFNFGSELNVSQKEEIIEGPHLQSIPSEKMRNHLVFIHSCLNKAVVSIQPDKMKKGRKELCKDIVKAYMLTSSKDHMRILNRQKIIEERKELLENLNNQKEAEERKILEDKQHKLHKAEKERMARETEERTKQRLLREQTELKRKVVMEKIEQLKKTEIGSRLFEGMDDGELEKLDPDDILNKQVEQLDRDRKELQTKLRQQERKIDHLERAKRIEETPLWQAEYEENKVKDLEFWEHHENERIKAIKEERNLCVQFRDRLVRLKDDKDKFLDRLKNSRSSVYEEKLTDFEKTLEEERKKRMDERKQSRKEERRSAWIKEKEEKCQRLIDEEMKRKHEEELAKLEEIEAKKRAREREIEEKLKREQELAIERKKNEDNTPSGLRDTETEKPSSQKSTSWRERDFGADKDRSGDGRERFGKVDGDRFSKLRNDDSSEQRERYGADRGFKSETDRRGEKAPSGLRDTETEKPSSQRSSNWRERDLGADKDRSGDGRERFGKDDGDRFSKLRNDDSSERGKYVADRGFKNDRDRHEGKAPSGLRDTETEKPSSQKPSSWRERDLGADKDRSGDVRIGKDNGDRFSKLRNDDSSERERYGADRGGFKIDRDRHEEKTPSGLRDTETEKPSYQKSSSWRERDLGADKDRSGDVRYGKDNGDRFSKLRNDDSSERRERYGTDRGGFKSDRDRPQSGRGIRDGTERRDDWRGMKRTDVQAPDSGSWRKDGPPSRDADKRGPRDEAFKRERGGNVDEDGFVKVRR